MYDGIVEKTVLWHDYELRWKWVDKNEIAAYFKVSPRIHLVVKQVQDTLQRSHVVSYPVVVCNVHCSVIMNAVVCKRHVQKLESL
jgi:hypothetical protein